MFIRIYFCSCTAATTEFPHWASIKVYLNLSFKGDVGVHFFYYNMKFEFGSDSITENIM